MTPYARRTFASLSGGEKQRALIARAIANAGLLPERADEPLDVYYQLEIPGPDPQRRRQLPRRDARPEPGRAALRPCTSCHDGRVAGREPQGRLTPELIRSGRVEAEVTTAQAALLRLFLHFPQAAEDGRAQTNRV